VTTVLDKRAAAATGRRRAVRVARTQDEASLRVVLAAGISAGANLDLVFPGGERVRVARPIDAHAIRSLIEATREEGGNARLEFVYDRRGH